MTASVRALVDCNNFFVSCERLFRPELIGKPVIVLSNNDGCIISRSNEAKALGIPMGVPFFKIKTLVQKHRVQVFSANFSLYSNMSDRVMATLRRLTPHLEVYSVDEAFLDLSEVPPEALEEYGRYIRAMVWQWTGIPVSIGIASSRTLAKSASDIAKKRQGNPVLALIGQADADDALRQLPVGDVWGVGRRLAPTLEKYGIRTALDLKNANDAWVLQQFNVTLLRTVHELRGWNRIGRLERDTRKSIISSRSFGPYVESLEGLRQAVSAFTARAAEKLRHDGLATRNIRVYLSTPKHARYGENRYFNSIMLTLPVATQCTHELVQAAYQGLAKIYKPGLAYQKAGVAMSNLVPAAESQQNLFETRDRDRLSHLMEAVDQINLAWGAGALCYAGEGLNRQWRSRREHRSQRYTTHWAELPEIALL